MISYLFYSYLWFLWRYVLFLQAVHLNRLPLLWCQRKVSQQEMVQRIFSDFIFLSRLPTKKRNKEWVKRRWSEIKTKIKSSIEIFMGRKNSDLKCVAFKSNWQTITWMPKYLGEFDLNKL